MSSDGRPTIWWVRRDFRLADNPALRSAIDDGEAVLPLFVLDPALLTSAGRARRAWLLAALYVLDRVDHAVERMDALDRYAIVRSR